MLASGPFFGSNLISISQLDPQHNADSLSAQGKAARKDATTLERRRVPMQKAGMFLAILALAASGCAQRVDVEAEAAAIRQATDVEWLAAWQAKNLERWVSFYTDDAVLLPPNAPILIGKEAIRAVVSKVLSSPGYAGSWHTTKIEVARSGDLAYSYGTEETTVNDAEGKPVTDQEKWVAVWKKQADGSWKCAVLILNSDLPAAGQSK